MARSHLGNKKPPVKGRSYKGEMVPKADLPQGGSIEGVFQGSKVITITDQNTHKDKDVMQYSFRADDGRKFVLLGAVMLDAAFDEVFQAEGGVERCEGLHMRISRGEDSALSRKRSMGNYEITVWED